MEGIERIKQLAAEVKDEALLEIINHLVSREDMNEKYLNEEKSLKQMIEFIRREAQKQAKDGMAMIKDEVVFGWAIHYFDESNEKLGLNKKIETKVSTAVQNEVKKEENAQNLEKTVQKEVNSSKDKYVAEGQLTLF